MSHPAFSKAGVMNFVQMSRSLSWRLPKPSSLLQFKLFLPQTSPASFLLEGHVCVRIQVPESLPSKLLTDVPGVLPGAAVPSRPVRSEWTMSLP
jgi:hypothetical protein